MLNSKKYFILLLLLFGYITVYPQVIVTLPNVSGLVDSEILAPVTVNDLTALNIPSFQFQVNYDQSKISILGVSTSGTLINGASPTLKTDVPGFIRIAYASASNISGSGVLLNLRIKFLAEGSSPLTYTVQDGFFKSEFGSSLITVTAVNGSATGTTTNLAPVFDSVPNQTVKEGEALTFTVHATDPESQALIYATGTLPEGATFTASTRQFTWTPNLEQAGTYPVIFIVSDGTNSAQLTVSIEVTDSNTPPQINSIEPKTVLEKGLISFEIIATDDEGDELTYTHDPLPTGAEFDEATHFFYWVPEYDQQGTYNIKFTVSDGKASTDVTVNITVQNVNQAPVFTKVLAAETISAHVPSVEFTYQYEASDADNDALTFSLEGSYPLGCSITSNGLLKWAPNANQVGMVYTITIKVSDGSLSSTTTTAITVDKLVSVRGEELPTVTELYQNYPNPFNPATTIEYALKNDSQVSISVFNILGQEVVTLVDAYKRAGYHRLEFNGTNLESGIYVYRIIADNFTDVKRMMLLK